MNVEVYKFLTKMWACMLESDVLKYAAWRQQIAKARWGIRSVEIDNGPPNGPKARWGIRSVEIDEWGLAEFSGR